MATKYIFWILHLAQEKSVSVSKGNCLCRSQKGF